MSPRAPRKIRGIENRLRRRRDGTEYWTHRLRWVDPLTGERVSQEFDDQADAIDFQAALRIARRSGGLHALSAGRETLAEYAEVWWRTYAAHNLAASTLANYSGHWNRHALPHLGHLQLRAITPGVIARFRTDLETAGVGAHTIRATMAVVQSILRRAVEEDRIPTNPVTQIRKPRAPRQRAVRPLAPAQVEELRLHHPGREDKILISLLAYAGLRPEEALALTWLHVRRDTLLVEQKNVDGKIVVGQKTHRPPRTIDLLTALRTDLVERQLAVGSPDDPTLLFPREDGEPWRAHDYRNWRRRTFQPAAHAAGLGILDRTVIHPRIDGKRIRRVNTTYDGAVPYDLRHSFASLLIHAGELSIIEIASQMGHSPEMLLRTYAHVFAELRGQPKVPADEQIADARERQQRRTG